MATAPPPRFRTALLISIALNVLLLAAIATGLWARRHGPPPGDQAFRLPHPALVEHVVPPVDRAIVREIYAKHRREFRTRIGAMRRARREVRDALAADPFDGEALAARLATLREREATVATAAHAVLGELAARVSPEGRAALVKLATERERRRSEQRRRERRREAAEARDPPVPPAP